MKPEILLDGLVFPESPRWHEGRLWFSDMHGLKVMAVDEGGNSELIVTTESNPSGLGWTVDNDLLVVSMQDRRLLRYNGETLVEKADLSQVVKHQCNDMVVDSDGYAYVGNFGFDPASGEAPATTALIGVSPEGEIRKLASDVLFPNGMAISADGRTLVVAESFGNRLSAFDIQENKSLSNQRVWAQLDGYMPDGIAIDKKGGIWVASALHNLVIYVEENKGITRQIEVSQTAFACAIGGANANTLYICTAGTLDPETARSQNRGKIEVVSLN